VYAATYSVDAALAIMGIGQHEKIEELARVRIFIISFAAFLYGAYRAIGFHPFYDGVYKQWLSLSPWSIEKSLPKGPVFLNPVDIIVVAFLCGLAYMNAAWPVIAFLTPYVTLLSITMEREQSGYFGAILLLWPFTFYPLRECNFAAAVLLVLYCICYFGVRKSLSGFPWNSQWWTSNVLNEMREGAVKQKIIGWPSKHLNYFKYKGISFRDAAGLSLVLTWWVHAVLWAMERPDVVALLVIISFAVMMMRIGTYLDGGAYTGPLTLAGRIFTGKLVISGYDIIFAAPLIILMCGTILPMGLRLYGVNNWVNFELCFFLIIFSCLAIGPNLKVWRLTGNYRIRLTSTGSRQKPPAAQDKVTEAITEKMKQVATQ
jgi:hypothetical protein